jgi:cell division protein FtsL
VKNPVRLLLETSAIRASLLHRIRTHRFFPLTALIAALFLVACIHVWQRVKVVELVKINGRLRLENAELIDETRKAYSQIARLSLASRIESYALDSLGMKPVDADRIFTLVPTDKPAAPQDELGGVINAVRRLAACVPVVSQTQAAAGEVSVINIDTLMLHQEDFR